MQKIWDKLLFSLIFISLMSSLAQAQTAAFTYQGKLNDGGAAANGQYDFTFRLFGFDSGGTPLAPDNVLDDVQVINGIFTANLDFGADTFIAGGFRYLEISVRTGASTGAYTTLAPRQEIKPAPFSLRSFFAAGAFNSSNLGGIAADQYVQTFDPRLFDARNPLPNSANYIQNNPLTQQSSSNFNISGNGTVGGTLNGNIVNAAAQFNIGGSRVLSVGGFSNTIVGINAGNANTGANNAFFGREAGKTNSTGSNNSFFGFFAGQLNETGTSNSFFGTVAGQNNTTGQANSFFGVSAGNSNTIGQANSFFGFQAGVGTISGGGNSFFGIRAGDSNNSGDGNSFFGDSAGRANTTGFDNTIIGSDADLGFNNLRNATAVGSRAFVTQSNTLILGSISGVNNAISDTRVGIGTTTPDQLLTVNGIASKVGGGSWAVFSDERLKNINGRFTRGIGDLMLLNPIRFEYKPDNPLGLHGSGEYIGFSAQELALVLPEAVSRSENGFLQVNNDPILWTMLNAVKEQQKQIETQQNQIDALKNLICELKSEAVICKE